MCSKGCAVSGFLWMMGQLVVGRLPQPPGVEASLD
jgi:hypothetical protein